MSHPPEDPAVRKPVRWANANFLLSTFVLGFVSWQPDDTADLRYAEYISSFKRYLYTQAWIDRLVEQFSNEGGFTDATGAEARAFDLSAVR